MDCANARLLSNFVRTGELDAAEREALSAHLAACPECGAGAQAEGRFDDALEAAMQRVPFPVGLKGRLLQRLAQKRPTRRWRWAAAAALFLVSSLVVGYVLWINQPEEFDVTRFVSFDNETPTVEVVEARFSDLGIAMKSPPEFNFNLLANWEPVQVQRRTVPKLTFKASSGELAQVYVMSTQQFKLPEPFEEKTIKNEGWLSEMLPASRHKIQIRRYPSIADFFFVVIYTTDSLDSFTFQGI
jgi:hypothetical protein